jgi:hypothetical protein
VLAGSRQIGASARTFALRQLAQAPEDTRLPLMSDADRQKMSAYVHLFRSGDFDAIRAMLADDVKLDLVNRLKLEGRDKIGPYFTRYAEVTKWRFALGAVEGQPAMLVFDSTGPMERPAHFVLIDWSESRIIADPGFRCSLPMCSKTITYADWGAAWVDGIHTPKSPRHQRHLLSVPDFHYLWR